MKYNFLRFPGGRSKAVTFSYDDGSRHDVRLIDTFNRYGLKGTFNLIGERVAVEKGLSKDFIQNEILAKGHEVANHGYEHRALDTLHPIEGIREVLDCRLVLEQAFGGVIRGFAFPDRSVNRFKSPVTYERVRRDLVDCGIVYTRVTDGDNDAFDLPEDWFNWVPTAHHDNPELFDYIERFLSMDVDGLYRSRRGPKLFYVWGHAHEFENKSNWERLDEICEKLAGHDDIWYATNMEIYDYVTAYHSLVYSADSLTVYNPSLLDVFFDVDGVAYTVKSGETIRLEK